MKSDPVRTCELKRTFDDRKAAKRFAKRTQRDYPHFAPTKPYRCPYCALYHLTKREK